MVRAGAITALVFATALSASFARAVPNGAVTFAYKLDVRTGKFAQPTEQPSRQVTINGSSVVIDGRAIALPSAVVAAAASPDGRHVAAETADTSECTAGPPPCGHFAIWIVNRDGSGLRLFSDDSIAPSWSPDSRRLAFIGRYITHYQTGIVTIQSIDGAHRRTFSRRERAAFPSWSSDGRLIAYTRQIGHRSWVRIIDVDHRQLVKVLDHATSPEWAPSGHRLAFVRFRRRGLNALASWDRGPSRILTANLGSITEITWSPHGRRIAFALRAADGIAAVGVTATARTAARIFTIPGQPPPGSLLPGAAVIVTEIAWTSPDQLFVAGRR